MPEVGSLVESLGITVRQLRVLRGLSQEQLAERSELNRSYVGEIERGQVAASIVTLQKLGLALDTNAAGLLLRCEHLEQVRSDRLVSLAAIAG